MPCLTGSNSRASSLLLLFSPDPSFLRTLAPFSTTGSGAFELSMLDEDIAYRLPTSTLRSGSHRDT